MIIADSQGNIACEIGVSGVSTTQVNLKNNDDNAYGVSIVPKQNMTSDIVVSLPQNSGTLARLEDLGEDTGSQHFEYIITEDNTVTITKVKQDTAGQLTLPNSIEGRPVTKIGDRALYEC
jgi:hypothetical protein